MKKIECMISDEKMKQIDEYCNKEGYTYAEFNRRAIDSMILHIENSISDLDMNAFILSKVINSTKEEAQNMLESVMQGIFNNPNIGTNILDKTLKTK